jgi:putative OPT family oligopeptide transporter
MQSVAEGIFGAGLPWTLVYIGSGIGVAIIAMDQYLKSRDSHFRMPILAVAVGLYLPFELDSSIFVGGVLAWMLDRANKGSSNEKSAGNAGLLLASGLITGEALMGILIAIAIVVGIDLKYMIFDNIGLILLFAILIFIFQTVRKVAKNG